MSDFLDTFAELNAAFGAQDGTLRLRLDQMYEDPHQPRETFDPTELRELAETIRLRGLLQPIVVRPPDAEGRYMIRFGARRYRAAQLAGLAEVSALIRPVQGGDAEALIEQVLENDQRTGLSTAERARGVARLIDLGLSQAEIGRGIRQPKDVIAMLAAVQRMPTRLQQLARTLGARTLYSLFSAWKLDAERTEAWLDARDAHRVTQAEARDFAAEVSRGAAAAPIEAERGASLDAPKPRRRDSADRSRFHLVEVAAGERVGVLDLTRAPARDGEVWVRFDGFQDPEPVPARRLTIRRVRQAPAKG